MFKAASSGDGSISGIKIDFTRLPMWPLEGLRDRLGKALGKALGTGVVGPFDPKEMITTWMGDAEKVKTPKNGKRKWKAPNDEGSETEKEDEHIIIKKLCLEEW